MAVGTFTTTTLIEWDRAYAATAPVDHSDDRMTWEHVSPGELITKRYVRICQCEQKASAK